MVCRLGMQSAAHLPVAALPRRAIRIFTRLFVVQHAYSLCMKALLVRFTTGQRPQSRSGFELVLVAL